jgi:DNA-binding CsgD family transcriptional regulator
VFGGEAGTRARLARSLADGGWTVVASVDSGLDLPAREGDSEVLVIHVLGPDESAPAEGARTATLTRRERQVLVALAQGGTDAAIALELGISISTVRSHLERIREKTGRRRRSELTRLAIEERLLVEPPCRTDPPADAG